MVHKSDKRVTLYLVRHGETTFNANFQVQGWSDTPLTEKGVKGAEVLGKKLAMIPFKKAYASDLGRAIKTARLLINLSKKQTLELTELIELREWHYGGFEGRDDAFMWGIIFESQGLTYDPAFSQLKALTEKVTEAEIAEIIQTNDATKTAESYLEIVTRVKQGIEKIIAEMIALGGGNALIVTHGMTILTILKLFVAEPVEALELPNCSVTTLVIENGRIYLETLGEQ
ncbi:histidine phosphatase family protein [Isobaculum melis]|uniref:Probable phosphoglycerate mutase n=1 Tax=Isobaculum melis TaxID=142588 RepID=A0A1H9TG66_9LACT|nr:histidine phosphatase family protein [Isobaculum melis]SER95819.1 probable phosphoglycerate mutase [Isobaculum melis]